MNDKSNTDIVRIIKNCNLPDKDIELYWYGFKNTIINFYKKKNIQDDLDLHNMCLFLNNLQKNKDYEEIESNICNFINKVCYKYIIHQADTYDCSLLNTQIKRWNRLSKKYSTFQEKNIYEINKNYIIFSIYYKYLQYNRVNHKITQFFREGTDYNNDKLNNLIDLSIENNYPYFLDKLSIIYDIPSYIKKKYGKIIHKNMKGNKIIISVNS